DELVVAEQGRRDRGDHTSSVERREMLLLDRPANLLDQAFGELPFRLDRWSELSRLHRSELLDQGRCNRSCHLDPLWYGTGTTATLPTTEQPVKRKSLLF